MEKTENNSTKIDDIFLFVIWIICCSFGQFLSTVGKYYIEDNTLQILKACDLVAFICLYIGYCFGCSVRDDEIK